MFLMSRALAGRLSLAPPGKPFLLGVADRNKNAHWFYSRKLEIPREHLIAKMGSIKDRNGMDLTEVEDIKKRWQEYTEELFKKDLHEPI